MTQDEVIALGLEAGLAPFIQIEKGWSLKALERFATLIEAKLMERLLAGAGESVAWLIDWPDEPDLGHYFAEDPAEIGRNQALYTADQLAAAVLRERESRKPLGRQDLVRIELGLRKYHDGDRYDLSLHDFARAIEAAHGIGDKT